ncbi:para-aminobenzoate synthase [Saccharata proteae CBS 121410]|uniref:aminodeoxychorismate synthase n=1 Tax=Saccharata proteae CBS 121410 TaxID=1314787 RepID=A0A9P4LTK5_9PEZI|nr:para-aminobenzoate synthase [Saccharata proteae CBS 121410]
MHSEDPLVPERQTTGNVTVPRILFIDAYDSFSNNIIALLQDHLNASVTSIHIDDPAYQTDDHFHRLLDCFDAVVAGPGPGTVTNSQDVGLIARLWTVPERHRLPVLGICLGFQSLALAFGAREEKLREPRHGIITRVLHQAESVFGGLGAVHATQYHSLTVRLQSSPEMPAPYWSPTPECPDLVPLAWDCDCQSNGPVLMAVKHASRPFWGVQYHPESICTSSEGAAIIGNWWAETCAWNARAKRAFDMQDIDVKEMCELLNLPQNDTVVLESGVNKSGNPVRAETGSHSIIGCPPDTGHNRRLEYHLSDQTMDIWEGDRFQWSGTSVHSDIWSFLQGFTESCRCTDGPAEMPFWGGLVGYVSYEAGLATIDVATANPDPSKDQPDICFTFIMRSVVIDHARRRVCVQSIMEDDGAWVTKTSTLLQQNASIISAAAKQHLIPPVPPSLDIPSALPTIDTAPSYESKVRSCQSSIRAGDSYEMCLTYQNHLRLPITTSSPSTPWLLYTRLRRLNPAPFGAFMRLGHPDRAVNIVSSSPERFLSWTRAGRCQYRPIKGTVKKAAGVTRTMAETILNSSKERAENLMIVDLVRHDLHAVVGTGNVRVTKLMGVEEYETVWQLVSVIEGDLTGRSVDDTDMVPPSGIPLLRSSLPPGSMTGAPKKRSCELLQSVERHVPRGVYSGVLGYLDVGGGGDFAVVIRTAFKWDGDVEEVEVEGGGGETTTTRRYETWRVGAGGAVTGLSEPKAEYEEMRAKLESTMRVFGES